MNLGDTLWDLHQQLQQAGYGAMDDATLKEVAQRLQNPNVLQAFQTGQLTVEQIVAEVGHALSTSQSGRSVLPAVPPPPGIRGSI